VGGAGYSCMVVGGEGVGGGTPSCLGAGVGVI